MPSTLISAESPPQAVDGVDDPLATAVVGPAVIMATSDAGSDEVANRAARPLAYRGANRDWHIIGYEAADHWEGLSPTLRTRLLADRTAPLNVEEFKATTAGASASMITDNWVRTGHPRVYRIAGELRELAEVLAQIGGTGAR